MQKYLTENIGIIVKICLIFCVGIILGIIIYKFADDEYREIIQNIFNQSKQENFEKINVLANGMKNNVIYILLLYMSLICIFTPFVMCVLILLKSISIGVYICTLFNVFGVAKGIVAVILAAIIPSIISLMGYVLICTNILSIYSDLKNGIKIEITKVIKSVYLLIISFSLLSFSLVIEQLASNVLINLYNNI